MGKKNNQQEKSPRRSFLWLLKLGFIKDQQQDNP